MRLPPMASMLRTSALRTSTLRSLATRQASSVSSTTPAPVPLANVRLVPCSTRCTAWVRGVLTHSLYSFPSAQHHSLSSITITTSSARISPDQSARAPFCPIPPLAALGHRLRRHGRRSHRPSRRRHSNPLRSFRRRTGKSSRLTRRRPVSPLVDPLWHSQRSHLPRRDDVPGGEIRKHDADAELAQRTMSLSALMDQGNRSCPLDPAQRRLAVSSPPSPSPVVSSPSFAHSVCLPGRVVAQD